MPNIRPYNIRLHLEGLKLIMLSPEPCGECPAFELAKRKHPEESSPNKTWTNCNCNICSNFIDQFMEVEKENYLCPCNKYGKPEAIELTKQILQKHFPIVWNEILIEQEEDYD